jgi:hypothetical protein
MKKAIRISTTGEVTELDLTTNSLTQLQEAVGGLVQALDLTEVVTMWCNEEGKMLKQPHNPYAQYFWDKVYGAHTDYIVGDIVLTGGTDSNGETEGLTDSQVETFEWLASKVREWVEPNIKVFVGE